MGKRDISTALSELVDRKLQKYVSGDQIWEEKPVLIEEFVLSEKYLDWKEQIFPGVLKDLKAAFVLDENSWPRRREVILEEGLGSGKSQFAAIAIVYILYILLCLRNPQQYLGQASENPIQLINCSPSGDQARRVVFSYISSHVHRCSWFKERGYEPDPNVSSELRFPKKLYITPSSSSPKTVLGGNLLVTVFDEMALFDKTKEKDTAAELYDTLVGRMKSRFLNKYLLIGISTARYVDDFIEERFKSCQLDEKSYARRRTVWESKPSQMYCGKTFEYKVLDAAGGVVEVLNVPIEYESDFKTNPALALRDLAARPSLTIQPFFKEFERVLGSINRMRQNPLPEIQDPDEKPLPVSPVDAYARLPEGFKGEEKVSYYVGLDLAKGVKDKIGFALVHKAGEKDSIKFDREGKQVIIKLPIIFLDLATRFVAAVGKEVDFGEIREFIHKLNIERGFKIGLILSDSYQSVDFRQIMTGAGYGFEEFSVDSNRVAYDTLLSLIYDNRFDWYEHQPLLYELQRLEDTGARIDHSRLSSKDISDSVAIASYFAAGKGLIPVKGDKISGRRNVRGALSRGLSGSGSDFSPQRGPVDISKLLPVD